MYKREREEIKGRRVVRGEKEGNWTRFEGGGKGGCIGKGRR